jgi:hypothetical protein
MMNVSKILSSIKKLRQLKEENLRNSKEHKKAKITPSQSNLIRTKLNNKASLTAKRYILRTNMRTKMNLWQLSRKERDSVDQSP